MYVSFSLRVLRIFNLPKFIKASPRDICNTDLQLSLFFLFLPFFLFTAYQLFFLYISCIHLQNFKFHFYIKIFKFNGIIRIHIYIHFYKKKRKKNILIYIPYYIIKDMGHLLLIYIYICQMYYIENILL